MKRNVFPAMFLVVILTVSAQAAIFQVPSEQPTIQAALDAAAEGDTVELADGSYTGEGNRDCDFLGKNLLLRSECGDPESCVIDSKGSETEPHRAFNFHSGESPASKLKNIGITGGWMHSDYYSGGGGVHCGDGCGLTIEGCVFFENDGSAIYGRSGSELVIRDCRFIGNKAISGAGASCIGAQCYFERCEFRLNQAKSHGGGIRMQAGNVEILDCDFIDNTAACGAAFDMIYGVHPTIRRCLIEGNTATDSYWSAIVNLHGMVDAEFLDCTFANNVTSHGGWVIVTSKSSHGSLRGCTFWGNSVPNGVIVKFGESTGLVANTIIAGNPAGIALSIDQVLELSCTNIFGNADGNWVDALEAYLGIDGNISEDPLFCDPLAGDFSLNESSPCAPFSPPNEACDLIGSWPVGCTTGTTAGTWSSLKTLF